LVDLDRVPRKGLEPTQLENKVMRALNGCGYWKYKRRAFGTINAQFEKHNPSNLL
jgi:hypothetical protein